MNKTISSTMPPPSPSSSKAPSIIPINSPPPSPSSNYDSKDKDKDKKEEDPADSETPEELLFNLHDQTVRVIQRLYRGVTSRRETLKLNAVTWVKEFDVSNKRENYDDDDNERKRFVYKYRNKITGKTQTEKPRGLKEIELDDPIRYIAPHDYNALKPPQEKKVRTFALILCNNTFASAKIPDISGTVVNDYNCIKDVLLNPYKGQCDVGDFLSCLNCGLLEFERGVESLRYKMSKAMQKDETTKCSLVVYLSTQSCTLKNSSSAVNNTYLLFTNTLYTKPSAISKTSLSITRLATLLKSMPCSDKTLLLDVVHLSKPENTFFRSRVMYPSVNVYEKIARESSMTSEDVKKMGFGSVGCGVTVIGSCNVGVGNDSESAADKMQLSSSSSPSSSSISSKKKKKLNPLKSLSKSYQSVKKSINDKTELPPPKLTWSEDKGYTIHEIDHYDMLHSLPSALKKVLINKRNSTFKAVRSKLEKVRSDAIGGTKKSNLEKAVYVDFDGDGHADADAGTDEGEGLGGSLFGMAVCLGLSGGGFRPSASNGNENVVKEEMEEEFYINSTDLYTFIYKYMQVHITNINAINQVDDQPGPGVIFQTPQITKTKTKHSSKMTTTCIKPSPPPPPDIPTSNLQKATSINLRWSNPPFSGTPPSVYNLQMRGLTNLNRDWKNVGYGPKDTEGDGCSVVDTCWFNVVHLVEGVKLQFRVRCKNYGGWSAFSSGSDFYTPGSSYSNTNSSKVMTVIVDPRTIISTMQSHPYSSSTQTTGLNQLLTHATQSGGFKRESVAKLCILACVDAMKKFDLDGAMCTMAVMVVGWCCYNRSSPSLAEYAKSLGALEIIKKGFVLFGGHSTSFVGARMWCLSQIKASLNSTGNTELKTHKERVIKRSTRNYEDMVERIEEQAEIDHEFMAVKRAAEKVKRKADRVIEKEEKRRSRLERSRSILLLGGGEKERSGNHEIRKLGRQDEKRRASMVVRDERARSRSMSRSRSTSLVRGRELSRDREWDRDRDRDRDSSLESVGEGSFIGL